MTMKNKNYANVLFLIILIEGYIILSAELLAIRQTVGYVGSGTDTISIIIASVLLPLALGYENGGQFKQGKFFGLYFTLRKKLIFNIVTASLVLLPGMCSVTIEYFFQFLEYIEVTNRIVQISAYCLLFISGPVYLLGQTIPLISNYFSKQNMSLITGKMLFFSTLGSCLGAIFSTVILMSTLGVNNTAAIIFIILTCLILILDKNKKSNEIKIMICISFFAITANSGLITYFKTADTRETQYNLITPPAESDVSKNAINYEYNKSEEKNYVKKIEKIAFENIRTSFLQANILVIGESFFTFGKNDKYNKYTYVAEKDIRQYLNKTNKKFDLILLSTNPHKSQYVQNLITIEFFKQLKESLNNNAVLIADFITEGNFNDKTSRGIDNTFREIFLYISRFSIDEKYNLWNENETDSSHITYIYKNFKTSRTGTIYTDDLNTVFWEKPKRLN